VDPARLKDIKIWGTVLEGRVQPVPAEDGASRKASLDRVLADDMPAEAARKPAHEPLPVFTSAAYQLRASRIANDLEMCGDHNVVVQALYSGLEPADAR